MRQVVSINDGWLFKKDSSPTPPSADASFERVELPHSYNAVDGMDGSSPWRGSVWYLREIEAPKQPLPGGRVFVEIGAAPLMAEVFVNGLKVCEHKGGYSRFRADVTDFLENGHGTLAIRVDNSALSDIYPQMADFTFYGGLTRGVKLVSVAASHFALGYYGADGLAITPRCDGADAEVELSAWIEGATEDISVGFEIFDAEGEKVAEVWRPAGESVSAAARIRGARRWSIGDPYLYTARARLMIHNEILDEVSARFGAREFSIDPQEGFFLNGERTVLRGVARHQDRMYKGSAVSLEDHAEDVALIKEVGANTVRCAHYQQSPEFYDLCDEKGLVVWAEIPYISVQADDPAAHTVAKEMMRELILQNYNHPSIFVWGLSNEITISGDRPGLVENHRELNDIAHALDKTRLTTMAHVSSTPDDHPLHDIPDVESYNHYFGWYVGSVEQNGPWLDKYHAEHPDRAVGLSEYGAEGIVSYHNEHPEMGDYSEEYQAFYHAEMCKILAERPWVWSSHVWNMFDFGCSARNEGGVKGRNNKGLVTSDRRVRKDSFYVCKANWSDEPFIHVCGARYAVRSGEKTRVMVCTNLENAALYANGEKVGETNGERTKVFENVPLRDGENRIWACADGFYDEISVLRAESEPKSYSVPDDPQRNARKAVAAGVKNWFEDFAETDRKTPEKSDEHFSVKDRIKDLLENGECRELLRGLLGDAVDGGMMEMAKNMTLEQNLGFIGSVSGEDIERLEAKLAKIKK